MVAIHSASAASFSAAYPTIFSPAPSAVHRFFGRRCGFFEITAFAASRMVWVER